MAFTWRQFCHTKNTSAIGNWNVLENHIFQKVVGSQDVTCEISSGNHAGLKNKKIKNRPFSWAVDLNETMIFHPSIPMPPCRTFKKLKIQLKDKLIAHSYSAWINNYTHSFLWGVINHPCPNFRADLVKLPLMLRHGWVITSPSFIWMYPCSNILKCHLCLESSYIHPQDGKSHVPWELTHWGRDKMAAISQTTLSIPFSWMKMLEFRLNFHWRLFRRVQLTIFQHWFR